MELQQRVDGDTGGAEPRQIVRVVDGWYETVERGYQNAMPILYFQCRSENGSFETFSVEGFRPYFGVARDCVDSEDVAALDADHRVVDVSVAERTGIRGGESDVEVLKVTTVKPYHVRQLRDEFSTTYEDSLPFPQRFLVDRGVRAYCEIPVACDGHLNPSDVVAVDETEHIAPRVVTYDIEVLRPDDGSMPDPQSPSQPITAIGCHDSTTDAYRCIALRGKTECWDGYESDDATICDTERELIQEFTATIDEWRPDVLTGYNSSEFDDPYLINRALHLEAQSIQRLSPVGSVEKIESSWPNSSVDGLHLFDLLDAYKKARFGQQKSYKLEDVAAAETDTEKLDVQEHIAYRNDPESFIEYTIRDVEATVAINEEIGLI